MTISAAGGWCAPSGGIDYAALWAEPGVVVERWPVGLTAEDREWIARMLHVAELQPAPEMNVLDLPAFTTQRGGILFPPPGEGQ